MVVTHSIKMLATIVVGTTAIMTSKLLLSPLLPTLIEDFDITVSTAGIALSIMWFCAALSQYPGGLISDRTSKTNVLLGGVVLAILAVTLIIWSTTFAWFVVGLMVLGIGSGVYQPVAVIKISDLFVDRRGQAVGVNAASINFAGVLSAGLGAGILTVWSWQVAFFPVVAGFVATLLFLLVWRSDEPLESDVETGVVETYRQIRTDRSLLLLLGMAALIAFTWQATVSFFPAYLQVEKGFSVVMASYAFASLFIVGVFANPVVGWFGDQWGHRVLVAAMCATSVIGLGILLLTDGLLAIFIGTAIFAIGLAAFWPVYNATMMETLSGSSRGSNFGAIRSLYLILGSLGPAFVGITADLTSYSISFAGLSVALIFAFGFSMTLTE